MLYGNKRIMRAQYTSKFEEMFACPICSTAMIVKEYKSVICLNGHTFDFAKQGYINFLSHSVKSKYRKELFEARRNLLTNGAFFEPLMIDIAKAIETHVDIVKKPISILDMGCGEGSHLYSVCERVRSFNDQLVGVGVDISKEGIKLAAQNYSNKIWVVANLAHTPFKNEQYDVILNVLSPSNYGEFNRLLKADGFVIKVVPKSGYLRELREQLFRKSEKKSYLNTETVSRFNESFQLVDRSRLNYTVTLNKAYIQWLVQMTPLTWTAAQEEIGALLNQNSLSVTIDLDILFGKKR